MEINKIKRNAVHLFHTNEKKTRHNIKHIADDVSTDNPMAICKTQSRGPVKGKGDKQHFGSNTAQSSLLCVNAKVALDNKNYFPSWGLHNGACGIVEEIVFGAGKNPNNGDLPKHVVVNFHFVVDRCGTMTIPR